MMNAGATSIGGDTLDVSCEDRQSDVDLDPGPFVRLLADVLAAEGAAGPGEASLFFVGRDEMTELNREHMGGDGPTDVLSFPLDGNGPVDGSGHRVVGDVIVCPEVAAEQAAEHAGTFDDEVALLVVHGALHLCGHDHAEAEERDLMWQRERALLDRCWGPLFRDAWTTS
ncbi:MAG TPA: rRNA maturation RNase YbeY [Microthrixaceae bacterium]|nr:rRNA maturation RNase YbeY [Microthrixaceae bacterium]